MQLDAPKLHDGEAISTLTSASEQSTATVSDAEECKTMTGPWNLGCNGREDLVAIGAPKKRRLIAWCSCPAWLKHRAEEGDTTGEVLIPAC